MKKINLAWLPYIGAVVQAGLFAMAGSKCFGAWGWLIGCGVGAVVNLSLAIASSRISEIAQKRQPLARLALFGMFLLSPTTITLSLYVPSSVFTSIAWAASPDLAIVLAGAIAGKSLVAKSEEKPSLKSAQKPLKRRSAKVSEIVCRYAGAGCGRKFVSQNAANAHARTCGFKPTISMPVDVSRKEIAK